MTNYWWGIVGYSPFAGEEFFTCLDTDDVEKHRAYAESIFPEELLRCYGKVSEYEAEMMGLDTY